MLKINYRKHILSFFVLSFLFGFICAPLTYAAPDIGLGYARDIGLEGEGVDLQNFFVKIVKILITFFGIIATAIIMLGGFKWMVSGGNSEQADAAKSIISSGIVGMVITLSAFMIVTWVFKTTSTEILGGNEIDVYY